MKKLIYALGLMALCFWFATAEAAVSTTTTVGPDNSDYTATLDGAILSSGGTAIPGVTASFAKRLDLSTPLYYGAEMGLFFQTSSPTYLVIPVLAHASYLFELESPVHPYVGVAAGPAFATGGGLSAVRLELMFRPGLNVELGSGVALNGEFRFGLLGTLSVVQPQLGVVLAI